MRDFISNILIAELRLRAVGTISQRVTARFYRSYLNCGAKARWGFPNRQTVNWRFYMPYLISELNHHRVGDHLQTANALFYKYYSNCGPK